MDTRFPVSRAQCSQVKKIKSESTNRQHLYQRKRCCNEYRQLLEWILCNWLTHSRQVSDRHAEDLVSAGSVHTIETADPVDRASRRIRANRRPQRAGRTIARWWFGRPLLLITCRSVEFRVKCCDADPREPLNWLPLRIPPDQVSRTPFWQTRCPPALPHTRKVSLVIWGPTRIR